MFKRRGNNMGGGPPDLLGVRIGKWIVRILFIGIEYALVHGLNTASMAGGSTTVYWTLIIVVWIVFWLLERFLRVR